MRAAWQSSESNRGLRQGDQRFAPAGLPARSHRLGFISRLAREGHTPLPPRTQTSRLQLASRRERACPRSLPGLHSRGTRGVADCRRPRGFRRALLARTPADYRAHEETGICGQAEDAAHQTISEAHPPHLFGPAGRDRNSTRFAGLEPARKDTGIRSVSEKGTWGRISGNNKLLQKRSGQGQCPESVRTGPLWSLH